MLLKKGLQNVLPCAGITLIRFTGMISDRNRQRRSQTPRETLKTYLFCFYYPELLRDNADVAAVFANEVEQLRMHNRCYKAFFLKE